MLQKQFFCQKQIQYVINVIFQENIAKIFWFIFPSNTWITKFNPIFSIVIYT